MATLDDLLDGPPIVEDINEAYNINPVTREIEIPASELVLGTEHDDKSECKFFRIPKVIGNDLRVMDCDVRIYYHTAYCNVEDCYVVKELIEQEDCVVFYWEISHKVVSCPGKVQFSVGITKSTDGVIEKAWYTVTATAVVLETLRNDLVPGEPHEMIDVMSRIESLTVNVEANKDTAQQSAASAASDAAKATSEADRAVAASIVATSKTAEAIRASEAAASAATEATGAANNIESRLNTALRQAKESGEFNGAPGRDGEDGAPGKDGAPGAAGVGIQSIVQTTTSTADNGVNVITVTKTDGTTYTLETRNGSRGGTPVKGVDYYTEADKQEIVNAVLSRIPAAEGASF